MTSAESHVPGFSAGEDIGLGGLLCHCMASFMVVRLRMGAQRGTADGSGLYSEEGLSTLGNSGLVFSEVDQ